MMLRASLVQFFLYMTHKTHRLVRMNWITWLLSIWSFAINIAAMATPVRPNPAWQWTAILHREDLSMISLLREENFKVSQGARGLMHIHTCMYTYAQTYLPTAGNFIASNVYNVKHQLHCGNCHIRPWKVKVLNYRKFAGRKCCNNRWRLHFRLRLEIMEGLAWTLNEK